MKRGGVLDVAFILDASGSVGNGNFAKMVSFTKKMVRRFAVAIERRQQEQPEERNISSGSGSGSGRRMGNSSTGSGAMGRSRSRFGVVRYNNSANVVFGFDMYSNASAVLSALDGMPVVTRGCTNTSGALEVAGIELFGLSMSCTSLGCHRNSTCGTYCRSTSSSRHGSGGSSSGGSGGGRASGRSGQSGRSGSGSGSGGSSSGRSGSSSSGRGRGRRSSASGDTRREVVVVLSDGNSNVGGDPSPCASELRAGNIEVFAVGIGNGIDRSELQSIASQPYSRHVVSVSSFDALESVLKQLEDSVCPGKQEVLREEQV